MSVPQLTTAEQFVVGVSRCWDAFLGDPDPTLAWRELAPVFAYMDVMGALCAFDRAFCVFQRHRLPALEFLDADSVPLGVNEGRMLCGIAHLQRCRAPSAAAAFTGALSRSGIQAALPPLARIAAILDIRGHRLPGWQDAPPPVPAPERRRPPRAQARRAESFAPL